MNQVSDGAEKFRAIFEIIYNTVGELLRQLLFRFSRAEKLILNEKGSDASDPFRLQREDFHIDNVEKVFYNKKVYRETVYQETILSFLKEA